MSYQMTFTPADRRFVIRLRVKPADISRDRCSDFDGDRGRNERTVVRPGIRIRLRANRHFRRNRQGPCWVFGCPPFGKVGK